MTFNLLSFLVNTDVIYKTLKTDLPSPERSGRILVEYISSESLQRFPISAGDIILILTYYI